MGEPARANPVLDPDVLGLGTVVEEGYSLTPSVANGRVCVKFCGNGDMSAVATLAGYLQLVHKEATRLDAQEVMFDFSSLYFMNSNCFKSFVSWIDTVKSGVAGGAYRITFVANPQLHWQRRSLEALRRMAEHVVFVQM